MRKIIFITICCLLFCGCKANNSSNAKKETATMQAEYSIDINSYEELVGDADYVIVGKVIKNIETVYEDKVLIEQEDGSEKEVGTPYTHYEVEIIENLKGQLDKKNNIEIIKSGGLSEDNTYYELYDNDILPEVGQTYIWFIYAQNDGSNLVSGANSTLPLEDDTQISAESIGEVRAVSKEEIITAIQNQILTDRQRFTSKDEVQ